MIKGHNQIDSIKGGKGDDHIYGYDGDDTIEGGEGNDTINGHGGNDSIAGGGGDDIIFGHLGNDIIHGGEGNDKITIYKRDNGNNELHGNIGNDTIQSAKGNDSLYGESGDDILMAKAGNDLIIGGDGNDTIIGGDGDDTAIFDGKRCDYNLSFSNLKDDFKDNTITVTSIIDGSTDQISEIENLEFSDIKITEINSAPSASNTSITLNEDNVYQLSTADFGVFSDIDCDTLDSIEITTLESAGSLEFDTSGKGDWKDVFTTQIIKESEITNRLRFTPDQDAHGDSFATAGFKVSDGSKWSDQENTIIFNVNAVNDQPVLNITNVSVDFKEGDLETVLDRTLDLTDVDSTTINSGKISIDANYLETEDILGFDKPDKSNIQGIFNNSTGELSLDGVDSIENYREALRSVTYHNTSNSPSTEERTISWVIHDGIVSSNPVSSTIRVSSVNNPPVFKNNSGSLEFVEGDDATVIAASLNLTDIDNTTIKSARIRIDKNYMGTEDILGFVKPNGSNIQGTFKSSTGELFLEGLDSTENYRKALQSISYENTSFNPNTKSRSITWLVNDGTNDSEPVTTSVTIKAINDLPILSNIGNSLQFTEGDGESILEPSLSLTDVDNDEIKSATIQISKNHRASEDVLGFSKQGKIVGTYKKNTGILKLEGLDTLENYQKALRTITYNNTSDDPNTKERKIKWNVNDGKANSKPYYSSVSITSIAAPPPSGGSTQASNSLPTKNPQKNEQKPLKPSGQPESNTIESKPVQEQSDQPKSTGAASTSTEPTDPKIKNKPSNNQTQTSNEKYATIPISIETLEAINKGTSFHLDSNTKAGTKILDFNHALTSIDKDQNNKSIKYSIATGNNQKLFSINKKGILSLRKKIPDQIGEESVYSITIKSSQNKFINSTLTRSIIVINNATKKQTNNCNNVINTIKTNNNAGIGSACHEKWSGNRSNEWIHGKEGDDKLHGQRGFDTIHGGKGHDTIRGGYGDDQLTGNSGTDHLYGHRRDDSIGGGNQNDELSGGRGRDTLGGGRGHDTLRGESGTDFLRGWRNNDALLGGRGNDTLRGGKGNDSLSGGDGNDSHSAGRGNDQLRGHSGNDTLRGGRGDDTLKGGQGADRFRISRGKDHILDYKPLQGDTIQAPAFTTLQLIQQQNNLLLLDSLNNIHTTLHNTSRDVLLKTQPDLIL